MILEEKTSIMENVTEDITSEASNEEKSDSSDLNHSDKESSESEFENNGASNKKNANSGWVDSIAKILKANKPKGKRSLVLSKAKKLTDVKEKPKLLGYEVETKDGTVKEEKTDALEELVEKLNEQPPKKRRKDINDIRIKPSILEKDREKTLSKIATKGVVQLFNAVKMQQKDIDKKLEEAGPLEVKRDKVMKNIDKKTFLDVLMGEKSGKVEDVAKGKLKKNYEKTEQTWNVLRDDFMMGAKLKDWDKELENEMESEEEA